MVRIFYDIYIFFNEIEQCVILIINIYIRIYFYDWYMYYVCIEFLSLQYDFSYFDLVKQTEIFLIIWFHCYSIDKFNHWFVYIILFFEGVWV